MSTYLITISDNFIHGHQFADPHNLIPFKLSVHAPTYEKTIEEIERLVREIKPHRTIIFDFHMHYSTIQRVMDYVHKNKVRAVFHYDVTRALRETAKEIDASVGVQKDGQCFTAS